MDRETYKCNCVFGLEKKMTVVIYPKKIITAYLNLA